MSTVLHKVDTRYFRSYSLSISNYFKRITRDEPMGFLVLEAGASWRGSRERVGWGGGVWRLLPNLQAGGTAARF